MNEKIRYPVSKAYADKFANIGDTFIVENGELKSATRGIVSGDSKIVWTIPIDKDTWANLLNAFDKMIDLALTGLFPNRSWGIWLDCENSQYMIESGQIFDNVDDALCYAIDNEQRVIYDIDRQLPIDVMPFAIDTGSFAIGKDIDLVYNLVRKELN